MLLWVGLGNPEPGMARNRHNIGFMALDVIAMCHGFSPWRQRFKGLVAEGTVGGQKILALKPMTYMNSSGESGNSNSMLLSNPLTKIKQALQIEPGSALESQKMENLPCAGTTVTTSLKLQRVSWVLHQSNN